VQPTQLSVALRTDFGSCFLYGLLIVEKMGQQQQRSCIIVEREWLKGKRKTYHFFCRPLAARLRSSDIVVARKLSESLGGGENPLREGDNTWVVCHGFSYAPTCPCLSALMLS